MSPSCPRARLALGILTTTLVSVAAAQPAPVAPASRPAAGAPAAAASTPIRPTRSAFDGYRPQGESPPTGWREANDTVGRIGGWRAYAEEARRAAAPAGAASAPAAGAHDGHHPQKGPARP